MNGPRPLCVGCLIDAIATHTVELQKWLHAGGDKRLMEFTPLKSWRDIVRMIAESEVSERQNSQPHSTH